jgi:hypothetical protein
MYDDTPQDLKIRKFIEQLMLNTVVNVSQNNLLLYFI